MADHSTGWSHNLKSWAVIDRPYSLSIQDVDGIHSGRSACGQGACCKGNDGEAARDCREDDRVHRLHAVYLAFQEGTKSGSAGEA
jgi:hypothetical protein